MLAPPLHWVHTIIEGNTNSTDAVVIGETLAQVHIGHPTEYIAFKSVLSPFTLICPNPRTRDVIVRHDIYNINYH
jgi:hypothetical protein